MSEYLVIHIGAYSADQLREKHGCPATQAVVIDAASEDDAIAQAHDAFAPFGPVERCLAVPFDPVEKVLVQTGPVFKDPDEVPDPEPLSPNPDVKKPGFVTPR